jgi:hypothetical protein
VGKRRRLYLRVLLAAFILIEGTSVAGALNPNRIDFPNALATGGIELVDVRSVGGSSGTVLRGTIRQNTNSALRIATNFTDALFLKNGNQSRQNMLATMILYGDGSYYYDDDGPFIDVESGSLTDVLFVGYCASFEKDNPEPGDLFVVTEMPDELRTVTDNLLRYQAMHTTEDFVVAAQVAVWLAQGEQPEDIQQVFPFTEDDGALARVLVSGHF